MIDNLESLVSYESKKANKTSLPTGMNIAKSTPTAPP